MTESMLQTEEFKLFAGLMSANMKESRRLEISSTRDHVKMLTEVIESMEAVLCSLEDELYVEQQKMKRLFERVNDTEESIENMKRLKDLLSIGLDNDDEEDNEKIENVN